MEKAKLLRELKKLADIPDKEITHERADNLLLEYIDDKEITEAYEKLERWYG